MDWIKALFIGVALVAGILAIPIVLAMVLPVLAFAALVGVIWFLLQVINHESGDEKPP